MAVLGRPISLLGRVAVGSTVPRGRRVELVFAYLAAEHHRLVSHDELADALWPAGLPDTWEPALRGVLTEVRRYLTDCGLDPATALATGRRGYQLRLPDDVTVDLDEARDGLAVARTLLAEGSATPAAERAGAVAGLATLPFLPDHEGEWADGIRREMATIAGRALEIQARALAAAGETGASAAAAERLVLLEPFNEGAHQLRIRLLGAAGDRAGAVRAYEHCRSVLADELGIEPSEETAAAFRAATAPATAAPAGPDEPATGFDHLTVLVVEDHDFQRRVAVMLLRKLGIGDVLEAADGGAALDLLAGGATPDVVVCDLDMPGIDGMEFIRRVAADRRAGAVIIASGLDAKVINVVRSVSESFGLQVLGAVEKPLTERCLTDLLLAYRPGEGPAPDPGDVVAPADAAEALHDGRITFHLRPAVDVATGAPASALLEARWLEPGGVEVASARFMTALQQARAVGELGDRAAAAAGSHLGALGAAGNDMRISVGIVVDHLHDASFADRATDGVDPAHLTFSLAETDFRASPSAALGLLTRLRVKGCGVALDGFGAGHAPDELVRALPLTEVRLAPSLVRAAAADGRQAAALDDALDAARRLDVVVVGDGADDDATLELLLGLGCDRLVGDRIAPAMPAADLAAWTASWDPALLVVGGAP